MLDTDSLRNEAFQHLHALPHFSADVIVLIEELEKSRETISVLNGMLDDDAKIIHGLVEHHRRMEALIIAARKFGDGNASKEAFEIAWSQFAELIIRP